MITLKNKKLVEWITEKDVLVSEGRKMSIELEKIEKEIKEHQNKEKEITGKIEPDEKLKEEGDLLVKEIEKKIKRLGELGAEIEEKKLDAIPKDIKEHHQELLKKREQLQREQNKIALKVQKIKDRVIPLIQREVKPLLQEYDDIETAKVKDDEVIINTFNHLEEFKKKFKSR